MASPPMQGWTDERVAALTRLWREGRSAAECARELGGGLTRNAVLGKIDRLGLQRDRAPKPGRKPAQPSDKAMQRAMACRSPGAAGSAQKVSGPKQDERSSGPANLRHGEAGRRELSGVTAGETAPFKSPGKAAAVATSAPPARRDAPPSESGVGIDELTVGHCRWPIAGSGTDLRYCGAGKPDIAKPYCRAHARLAYQPILRRRRAAAE